jgi:hypothetical protein
MPRDICGLCGFGQFLHKDETEAEEEEEKSKKVVEALHKIFRLFLLRRVKSNVQKNLLPSTCSFSFFFRDSCLCVADLLIFPNRGGDQYLCQAD